MKIDISKDVYEIRGTVIKAEEQRYTSTTVSGGNSYTNYHGTYGAHVSRTPITSTTHHHQNQRIWIRDENGNEQDVSFYNKDVSAREDNVVRMIASRNNNDILRFINETTGRYWRISRGSMPTSVAGRVVKGVVDRLVAMLYTLFVSLPVMNVIAAISYVFRSSRKRDFVYAIKTTWLHRWLFAGLVVVMGGLAYAFYDDYRAGYTPEIAFDVSPETQVETMKVVGKIFLPYLKAGDPLGLIGSRDDVAKTTAEIERVLATSTEVLIAREHAQSHKVYILNPNDKESLVALYMLLTLSGMFVLYFYKRKLQKIDYHIGRQLEEMS